MAKRIVYIGSAIPESMINRYRTLSFNAADNIAQLTLVQGLKKYYGDSLTVITLVSNYNENTIKLDNELEAYVVKSRHSNRIVYYLSLTYGYVRKVRYVLRSFDPEDNVVILSRGSYVFVYLSIMLAKMYRRVKWIPFIVTTVEVPEYKFPLSMISKLSKWVTPMSDGIITYVARTATDYVPNKPYVKISYAISKKIMSLYHAGADEKPNKFTITYTGSFDDKYNTSAVVDVIRKTGNRYRWEFAGTGKDVEAIIPLTKDRRYDVRFYGLLSQEETVKLQLRSSLLLCLRLYQSKANEYYYKYAASAKLAEYLCSGVPVLASNSPSNSKEIKQYMTLEDSVTAASILNSIEEIEKNYSAKLELANKGQAYAIKHFTAEYQNKKIYGFLESL